MRRLVVVEFITLDWVMQSLGSQDVDTEGVFEHGGWSAPYFDEAQGKAAGEGMAATEAFLLAARASRRWRRSGRTTSPGCSCTGSRSAPTSTGGGRTPQ